MDARRSSKSILILILILAAIAAFYLFSETDRRPGLQWAGAPKGGPPYFVQGTAVADEEVSTVEADITCSRNNAIVQAAQKVGPSVVSISTVQIETIRPWFEQFGLYDPSIRPMKRKHYGLGSGFIIDKRGYVLTNQHVIADADETKVTLPSGEEFEAKIIGASYESDLAVLKIESRSDLPVAELGDSSGLMVGEWAIAVGNPFGFLIKDSVPSISLGVISATDRSLQADSRAFNQLIQTDATINPGNSGGPLANCYGQVIGINTAIYSTSGGSQGVGFAISINAAKNVIEELIQHGMVREPWLGIEYQGLNKDFAEHLGSPVDKGIFISDVVQDSPAQAAGLKQGDIVTKIGKQSIRSLAEATSAIESLKIDQEVTFHIVRDGEFQDAMITVGTTQAAEIARTTFGLIVQEPTPESATKYKLSSHKRGVMVIHVDGRSPAHKAELQRGDLIIKMSREQTGRFRSFRDAEINSLNDFRKFVDNIKKGQRVRILFERKGEMWRTELSTGG